MAGVSGLEKIAGGGMIGIDTNVLLRLFTDDNPAQTGSAVRLVDGCASGSIRITNIVLVELVWVLLGRKYNLEKPRLVEIIEELLRRAELVFENRGAVMTALRWFEAGKSDFSDYLIAALNEDAGASPTYAFDQMAAGNAAFALMTP